MQDTDLPDPFLIPGTDTLRNHFALSGEVLERVERLHTQIRQEQPLATPEISARGFQAMHKHLFETIYPWAGEVRTSHSLTKGSTSFLHGRFVPDALQRQFELLGQERNLSGLDLMAFADRAAFHLGELNYIHPFREGNGRTMRIFLKELARQAGYDLRLDRIDRDAWMQASRESSAHQNIGPMNEVIRQAIVGRVTRAGRGKRGRSAP